MPYTLPERVMRTFRHEPLDKIVWQPRIMYWYNGNKIGHLTREEYHANHQKFVPEEWINYDIKQVYDSLGASIRYPGETLGISMTYQQRKPEIKANDIQTLSSTLPDGAIVHTIKTPVGTVEERIRNGYHFEHIVKKVEDLEVAKYLVNMNEFCVNDLMVEAATEEMERYGIPTTYYFRSPYQRSVLELLGFETTVKFLRRYPKQMADFFETMETWCDTAYDVLCKSSLKILNFGENIDAELSPPPIFEKYHIPFYKKCMRKLHDAGKFGFIHIDGSFKDLLPYLAELPFDGLEALTPFPQGDVTVKEIADNIGHHILLDGIPATVFMPEFPEHKLIEITQEIFDLIAPNVILGVSDELPPNADGRRLFTVSKMVEKFDPPSKYR